MNPHQQEKQCRTIGVRLAVVLRECHGQLPAPAALQAIAADLVGARTELLIPLKHLVSRPGFQQLISKAGSGSGGVEMRALLVDLEITFTPALINSLEEVLSGFLDLPTAAGSATTKGPAERPPSQGVEATVKAGQTQPSARPSPQLSATPPEPLVRKIAEASASKNSPTRGINPVSLALGICIATASVVVAGIAAMRSPLLCTSLGLCLSNGDSTAAEQSLDAAQGSAEDLERATTLERFRSDAKELERALQRLDLNIRSLTIEQQRQKEILNSISRKAKATVLQEEADQKHLQQAEMALAAVSKSDGAERQELIKLAIEALQSIAAGGFAEKEATRLQQEIDQLQIEEPSMPGAWREKRLF